MCATAEECGWNPIGARSLREIRLPEHLQNFAPVDCLEAARSGIVDEGLRRVREHLRDGVAVVESSLARKELVEGAGLVCVVREQFAIHEDGRNGRAKPFRQGCVDNSPPFLVVALGSCKVLA